MKYTEEVDKLYVNCVGLVVILSFLASALAEAEYFWAALFITFWTPSRGTCCGVARNKALADANRYM